MSGNLEVEIGPFSLASTERQATRDRSLAQSPAKSDNGNTTVQIVRMTSFGDCGMSDQSKLSGATNYGAWKFRMKNILMREMLWHLVSPDPERAFVELDVVIASQQRMRVLAIINLLVRDEVIPHISHLDSPDEVSNVLKEIYGVQGSQGDFF